MTFEQRKALKAAIDVNLRAKFGKLADTREAEYRRALRARRKGA